MTNVGLIHAIDVMISPPLWFSGGYYLMSCIKDVPTLRGDNYSEWKKMVDFAFICVEVDWVVDTPQPVKPKEPERDAANDDDATWDRKKRDYISVEMSLTTKSG